LKIKRNRRNTNKKGFNKLNINKKLKGEDVS